MLMPSTNDRLVLIVEDEETLADVLRDYVEAAGYRCQTLGDGAVVVEWVKENDPDLIVLDLMLPGEDGMSICSQVRGFSAVPIIMTTARVEEIDRLLGLELGADDYVCKPYSAREVVARIKATFRRLDALSAQLNDTTSKQEKDQELILDELRFQARLGDTSLILTPGEFRLLAAIYEQPGRIYSRSQLIDALYSDGRVVTERTVDTHVKNLRKKLALHFDGEQFIASVYGVGYKYEPNADR